MSDRDSESPALSFGTVAYVAASGLPVCRFQVIGSKQRPRKITIHGEDGRDYLFLLKVSQSEQQAVRAMGSRLHDRLELEHSGPVLLISSSESVVLLFV